MSTNREQFALSKSIRELSRQGSVPFLPGHQMTNLSLTRKNHRRDQTLLWKPAQGATQKIASNPMPLDAATIKALAPGALRPISAPAARGMQRSTSLPRIQSAKVRSNNPADHVALQPAWLKHDRQCLRFYGYFQQAVFERPDENFQIRCVILTYFLEDGTLQVTEQKVANSGIWPQGPFVKRHRVPHPDGGFYSQDHLKMGISVTIYGHTFRIINADAFTKWFYEQADMDIGTEEEQPLDNYLETQVWKTQTTTRMQGLPQDVMDSKIQNEKSLGGGGGYNNRRLRQFLENDRKVLRFYGYWDDPTRYGARHYLVIHYYLADDTIEMNTNYIRNVGRSTRERVFLKRGPLEINPSTVPMPGMIKAPSPILLPFDIEIGKCIPVYGRQVFIYECDPATREFYKTYMGRDMENIKVPDEQYLNAAQDAVAVGGVHKKLLPPPYVYGRTLGSEQDTLNGCIQVTERNKPHRDMTKLFMYGNKALRFEAKPENSVPEDAHRIFLIEYYIADNTLLVGDRHVRNSGCWDQKGPDSNCRKFKERDLPGGERRTINPDTGRPFEIWEFYVGALLKILCMPMRIVRADEFTLKFMETDPVTFPMSSMRLVGQKIAGLLDFAADLPASLTPEELGDVVHERLGVELTDQELITVLRNACEDEAARVNVARLCEAIRNPPVPPPPEPRPGDPMPEWLLDPTLRRSAAAA